MVIGSAGGIGRAGEVGGHRMEGREGLECMVLTVSDDMGESRWVRMKVKASKADVVGV